MSLPLLLKAYQGKFDWNTRLYGTVDNRSGRNIVACIITNEEDELINLGN